MMHSFELPRHRRANVWLDEAPPADFTPASLRRCVMQPRVVVAAALRIAAVELRVAHGPSSSYGLLGAELVDENVDGLEVVVSVNTVGFPFRPSLALQPEEVTVGLLDEYSNAVLAGVARVAESIGAPRNASLRFRWAAHGLVGSSCSIFEQVSGIVVQLLTLPRDASTERIRALLL